MDTEPLTNGFILKLKGKKVTRNSEEPKIFI